MSNLFKKFFGVPKIKRKEIVMTLKGKSKKQLINIIINLGGLNYFYKKKSGRRIFLYSLLYFAVGLIGGFLIREFILK